MRKKMKGFRIKKRVSRISRWITRIRRSGYNRIHATGPDSKLKSWGQRLTQSFRKLTRRTGSGYKPAPVPVPRGHLAIYVGQKDGDCHRVLVPIVYFNHPLFGELLRESEKEFGFRYDGGIITILCPYSDFERVKTRIQSGSGSRIFSWSSKLFCRH